MPAFAGILIAVAATLGHPASLLTSPANTSPIPVGAVPAAVSTFCEQRAQRHAFTVLCPTRYPRTKGSRVTLSGKSLLGPSFYWASFNDPAGFDGGDRAPGNPAPSSSCRFPG